ncbi:MAG: hypothetical protein V3T49_02595 [Dehalococcoidia bacterium]
MNTDPSAVRDVFASHYFLFAFLASLGTLQIAVANSGIRGLWLTPNRLVNRWLGIGLIIAGIAVFFGQPLWIEGPWAAGSIQADSVTREWGQASWSDLAGARNVNDIHGGLDGTKQAIWFPLAAIMAFIVSALVGALNIRFLTGSSRAKIADSGVSPVEDGTGLAGLAHRSYFANLPISLKTFSSELGEVWRDGLRKADRWSLLKVIFGRSSN